MTGFVLDCSMTLAWCFSDEANNQSIAVLRRLRQSGCLVPPIWTPELVNGLLVAERRGRISFFDVTRLMAFVRALPVTVDMDGTDSTTDRIISLARSHSLSAYDASYLELAVRKGVPLATLDNRLSDAAALAGIQVLEG